MKEWLLTLSETTPKQWVQFLRRKLKKKDLAPVCFDSNYLAVFVLSTGRAGTKTMAALLDLSPRLVAYHEPFPKLFGLGKKAYLYGEEDIAKDVLREALVTTRKHLWRYALDAGLGYAETSPQITFLAQILKSLHPHARFIHLVRHPFAVVRSGIQRGWYHSHPNDQTRIIPKKGSSVLSIWGNLSREEKIAWLWAETNRWIMQFLDTLPAQQKLFIQAEMLFKADSEILRRLYEFTGYDRVPSLRKINNILGSKLNANKIQQLRPWSDETQQKVWKWTADIAVRLGYTAYDDIA